MTVVRIRHSPRRKVTDSKNGKYTAVFVTDTAINVSEITVYIPFLIVNLVHDLQPYFHLELAVLLP
jgi:hypothetical protein